ncbi:hypothetical protein OQY15_17030 [Pedobacter sp. MC2016-15]|uniref:hypothetical protein n=1 Tax=Pedobacter sp. MC2016-15 TaxID=2994473 RepID=UPI002247E68D|nr:hypothetical protein [Pedobacter sp. MC2016-15]MCX2480811.1 hypothetical protein [Pedobacter sp. MC2016-15]
MISKRLILSILLCFTISALSAQKLKYFQGTFEEAKAAAKKQRKLIYVMVDWGNNTEPNSPLPLDDELLKKYHSGFICIYKNATAKAGLNDLYQKYNISTYPTHLYLDAEGSLLLKTVGFRTNKEPYLTETAKAIQLSKEKTLTKYQQEYEKGSRNEQFLKNYLLKYDELDIPVNQEVLEAYANTLPVNKLDDFETISFLIQRAPALSSMAYKITRVYPKLTDSVYKSLPSAKRGIINNRIIRSSLAIAKSRKDEKLALETAAFTQNTWSNNWQRGMTARTYNMMEYYLAVKDTTKYLSNASSYYQQYYLMLRDSLHRQEGQMTLGNLPNQASQKTRPMIPQEPVIVKSDPKADSARIVTQVTMVTKVVAPSMGISNIAPKSQNTRAMEYAMTLNNGAWTMYTMKAKIPAYLSQAVIWVYRSIELFPENPAFHDTLAHLLYQQQKYTEALTYQEKAVVLARAEAKNIAELMARSTNKPALSPDHGQKAIEMYTAELEKMRSKTL